MSNTVKTVTTINEQVIEVVSNLETNKISEKLEDISTKVNQLLTGYISKENDESSVSSQDEYEGQTSEETSPNKCLNAKCKNANDNESEKESNSVDNSETSSRGKRHKKDTSDK
ncbi:unnamed protein product [Cryptosporidium hominis]|uniref:Uncharacterized protein n=1 Tax=Cryptosporidium hominis TaxID=237895 RepID=A0A0S4TFM1_CRYHO|nr:hypothetical protein [Cryptosporidium hominis TU502]OLQ16285.1 hypothetical protein ChTU502y2012_374g0240 [Cryptosporidium hominis]PPA64561.1 hypothetical protein ChUKH1_03325 [Cryptosporidium hominis]PPS96757.1 Uncharacterized protein GY17_00001490 [Cryptosporidium hominis]CUV06288.1 unnamed protein product [Cryptosporidium hominis]|eukprot:PPS96757.1 Uncharacterized protein GY17_00001490 [Cryptosporidium hominis]